MLELLETFCAVAAAGSFNKAAESLHLTQPAITRQMKQLEQRLGAVLFTRTKQGVQLTPAGQAVLVHARQAVAAVAACAGAAAALSDAAEERLRISAGIHVAMYVLPPLLARFQAEHPTVQIELRPWPYRTAIERLLAYEADVAIVGFDEPVPGVRELPLFEDPLVLMAAATADRGPVRVADLEGQTLLVLPPDSGHRRELEWVLERSGVACHLIDFPNSESLKTAVLLGMGVAVVSRSVALAEAAAGKVTLRPFADWPEPVRLIRALVRAEGAVPAPVRAFLKLCQA
ncbi:MAG TPA: LysR family transcriptional regulator [Symbiobacteriaceae bacterium]|nr:LysR family transcriptional regulator [Symbiobacteriaceae bacterium]